MIRFIVSIFIINNDLFIETDEHMWPFSWLPSFVRTVCENMGHRWFKGRLCGIRHYVRLLGAFIALQFHNEINLEIIIAIPIDDAWIGIELSTLLTNLASHPFCETRFSAKERLTV